MIEINLLPDVKLHYLRTQRNKRLVIGGALAVAIFIVVMTVLLALHVYVNQNLHTNRLQKDIDEAAAEFTAIENLGTVLTVREQLIELPGLHNAKPQVTRLPGLLAKVIPGDIELNELSADFDALTMRFSGQGKSTKLVNTFADVLKNTYFTYGDGTTPVLAFSAVEFEIGVHSQGIVNFDVELTFDMALFDATNESLEITIPDIVSTQSANRSSALFEEPVEEEQP